MKNLIRSAALSLFLAAGLAYGGVPPLNVTVSDSTGKAAFKGTTDKTGAFTTSKMKPGNYVVQINSSGAIPGSYSIVVAAGVKKVSASAVAGAKFAKGGVALKLEVGNLLNIVGQVAAEAGPTKNGKNMVWIGPKTGSNRPGHWVEADSAEAMEAKTSGNISSQGVQNMQDRGH